MRSFICLLYISLFTIANSHAQDAILPDTHDTASVRFFTGIGISDVYLVGAYDGTSYFRTKDEYFAIPKLSNGVGPGLRLGILINNRLAMEFGYVITKHRYSAEIHTFAGQDPDSGSVHKASGNVFVHAGNLALSGFYPINQALQLYASYLDFSISVENIEQASYAFSDTAAFGDVSYTAMVLGIEGGIAWNLTKKIRFNLGIFPAWHMVVAVKGITGEEYETEAISNFRLQSNFGITYLWQ